MTPLRTPVDLWRTALAALSFVGIVFASSGPSNARAVDVRLFPSGEAKDTEQIRLEFSAPVVAPSEKGVASPGTVDPRCGKGTGTWLDDRTWAFTFQEPVAGGLLCEVTLDPAFAARAKVLQKGTLAFHTGGPSVEDIRPYEHGSLDEDTVLAVTLSARAQNASIAAHARLVAEDIASPIGVTPFVPEVEALKALFRYDQGFKAAFDAGRVVFLRPSTTLPPGRSVTLVWGQGILSAESGLATSEPQEFKFEVRSPLGFKVECARENATSGCVPLSAVDVAFSADVAWEKAAGVNLVEEPKATGRAGSPQTPRERRPRKAPDVSPLSLVSRVTFPGPFPPGSRWRVVIPEDFRDDTGRSLEALPRSAFAVEMGPVPVLAKFQGPFGVVEASDPVVPLYTRALEKTVDLRALVVTPADLARTPALAFRWHDRVRGAQRETSLFDANDAFKSRPLALEGAKSPGANAVEGVPNGGPGTPSPTDMRPFTMNVVGLPLPGRGLHVLELTSRVLGDTLLGDTRIFHVASAALVTDLALHVKTGRTKGLAWVTSLATSEPVRGARIHVVDCRGKSLPGTILTDARGLAEFSLPKARDCENEDRLFWSGVGVVATLASDATFTHSTWDEGFERWRFHSESSDDPGLSSSWGDEDGGPTVSEEALQPIAAVLDRTLLRAGETLHVALSAWAPRNSKLVASRLPGTLELRHLGSGDTLRFPLAWNAQGRATLTIPIPETQKRGTHSIILIDKKDEKRSVALVRVEDFQVPSARAFLTLTQADVWKKGGEVVGDVQVEYLSGGSPAGQEVEVALRLDAEDGRSLPGSRGYIFATRALQPGLRRTNDVLESDAEGASTKARKVRLSPKGLASARAAFTEKDALYIRAQLEARYDDLSGGRRQSSLFQDYAPASSIVGLSTRNDMVLAGRVPLRGKVVDARGRPVSGAKVVFAAATRERYSVRKKILGGFYAYESYEKVGVPKDVCEATSDARGLAVCAWQAQEGSWSVEARHTAPEGITTRAVSEFTVYGEKPEWFPGDESDRISLFPDKASYRPGDIARIRLEAPFQRAKALVTVETGDVLDAFVVDHASNRPFVDIPLQARHAPNVKVGVLLQRARLAGEKRPGPGEVDLAKPSIRMGLTSLSVERVEQTLVVAMNTDAEEYRVRGQGTVKVTVRDAQGAPPPAGTRVTVFAVDEALLDLEPNETPDVLAALLPKRGHGVDTATNLSSLMGRRHFGQKARAAGGGGGRLSTRELFDTLLVWKPHLPLDAQGQVDVPFTLNDSLTRFRFFASAVASAERKAGHGSTSIATRQDILLLPRVPLAVREGDVFEVGFLARNTTSRAWTLVPSLAAQGADVLSTVKETPFTLAPGEERLLTASVRAHPTTHKGASTGAADAKTKQAATEVRATLTLHAAASGTADPNARLDAMTAKVRIEPQGRLRSLASSVDVATPGTVTRREFRLDGDAALRAFTLSVAPVGVGDTAKLAAYLASYPYSCTEQLLSKAVVVEGDRGKAWTAFVGELTARRIADNGLAKYFPGSNLGSPYLTATVLVTADAWKRPLPKDLRDAFLGALRQSLDLKRGGETASPSTRALILEALARAGHPLPQGEERLAATPARLAWDDFATLLSAGVFSGRPFGKSLLAAFPNRLTRAGATWDLRAEPGLAGASAQAVRAKLLVTFHEAREKGLLSKGEWQANAPFLASLARTHALASQSVQHPGTTWSVWGLLAARHLARERPTTKASREALESLVFPWELGPLQGPIHSKGDARPFRAQGPFETTIALDAPGTYAFKVSAPEAKAGVDSTPETLVFAHVRTSASVPAAEHRGLRAECAVSKPTDSSRQGDTLKLTFRVRAQAPQEWTVVDIPLPPGAQILSVDAPGGQTAADGGARPWGVAPAYVEKTALAVRVWYDELPAGEANGEVTLLMGTRGAFGVPGCHAEVMREPDVSSTLPSASWTVR